MWVNAASSSSSSNVREPRDFASSSVSNSAVVMPRDLSWTNHFIGKPVSLALGADGMPLSPVEQRAQIMRPLEFVMAVPWFFALHSPETGVKRHRQEPLPPIGYISAEYHPSVPLRIMFGFGAFVCPRLAAAPRNKRVTDRMKWGLAECVMERVTRGHVRRVQVRLMRALAVDSHALAVDSHCSKRWLIFGCVAPHHCSFIKLIALFIPCLQAAAADLLAAQPDILSAAENGDYALVLCHLIADSDSVNKKEELVLWSPIVQK